MNKLKKKIALILSILIITLVCMGLTGCGNNNENGTVEKTAEQGEATKNESVISESEALSIGKELYSKATSYYFGDVDYDMGEIIDEMYYRINNLDQIKSDFTEQGFKNYIDKNDFVKEVDGQYYRIAADRGSDIFYIGNVLEIEEKSANEIEFVSIEKYIVNDSDLGLEESQITDILKKENKFLIKKVDGRWKIEEFTLPL